MLADESPRNEFWCPLGEGAATPSHASTSLTPTDRSSLARLAAGEWLPDTQITRLVDLGMAERVFGHALLTRLGRDAAGLDAQPV